LYRSTFSGGPYALVASAILGTSFVDQSVTTGETYFYVATAWDGTKESGFSNQVTVVVP
jgi:fibronectin type 3 domain-containing protein